jgi:serralysin
MATLPVYTPAQVVTQITTNWGGGLSGKTLGWNQSTVTYSINVKGHHHQQTQQSNNEADGFVAMTTTMVGVARYAFEMWDSLIAISLNESVNDTNADITFAYSSNTGNRTYSFPANATWAPAGSKFNAFYHKSGIWLSSQWASHDSDSDMGFGGYGLLTYMHEIGHSLLLSHPGTYNFVANYAKDAKFQQDNHSDTIMSYFRADEAGYDNGRLYPQTPMLYDVLALQQAYGADTTTRTGDTTYGFHSNTGLNVFDFTVNTRPILTIWDASGTDTLDLSGFAATQVISMVDGTYSDVAGMTHNLAIAFGAKIENLVGGTNIDRITGNTLDNKIEGLQGDDTIDGGGGTDTAVYNAARAQFSITTAGGVTTVVHNGGNLGTDTLTNVEKLQFTDQTVTLSGAAQVVISAAGGSVTEGDTGTVTLAFTVTLNKAATDTVTVDYAANTGTASSPADYTAATGTLTFAAGETSKIVNVTVNGDTVDEIDESVNLVLSNATNATFSSNGATLTVTGTIRDDDTAITDDYPASTATTGRIGAGDTVKGTLETTTDADWFAATLVAGHTYRAAIPAFVNAGGTFAGLTFRDAAGNDRASSANGTVDFTPTANGTYYLDVSSPAGLIRALGSYDLSLADTGQATKKYTLSIANVSVAEDGGSAVVTVKADAVIAGSSVTFDIATANGSATAGSDFTAVSKSVSLGNTDHIDIVIPILDDATVEGSETFQVNVTNIQGATAANGASQMSATVTIIDNDSAGDDYGSTTATAGTAALGDTHGKLETNADTDWLRMDLKAGNIYTIGVKGADSNGGSLSDPYARLLDNSGTQIDWDDDSGKGLDPELKITVLQDQTFYVDVQSYQNSLQGTYTVNLAKTSLGETSTEGGGDFASSVFIPADFAIFQTLNYPGTDRDDYYAFQVNTPVDLYFNLTEHTADLDLYLYNAAGTQIDQSLNLGSLEEEIAIHLTATGTYYIRVAGYASSVTSYYLQGAAITDTTKKLEKSDAPITMSADKGAAFLTGRNHESITGTSGANWLVGNLGNNILNGQDGDDFLGGGPGNDFLMGGRDDDYMVGGLGDDNFIAETGNDTYIGGSGFDSVGFALSTSGITIDLSKTTAQTVNAGFGTDIFLEIEGVVGSRFGDLVTGNSADNAFDLSEGDDTASGGDGNDLLRGGKGNDILDGGNGTDTVNYEDALSGVTVSLATTTAQNVGGGLGSDTISNMENISGSGYADKLTGDGNTNVLSGGQGADGLYGGAGRDLLAGGIGADILDGGIGEDWLYGGPGDDIYYVDETLDFIDEGIQFPSLPGGGNDTLISTASWYYESNFTIENLNIAESAAGAHTTLVGGGFDNIIRGNTGDNNLYANWGNDTIYAGRGLDHIDLANRNAGATGANTVMFEVGNGYDIIWNFQPGTDKVNVAAFGLGNYAGLTALGHNDGLGNSYFALGATGTDYLYIIGQELSALSAGDFIFV